MFFISGAAQPVGLKDGTMTLSKFCQWIREVAVEAVEHWLEPLKSSSILQFALLHGVPGSFIHRLFPLSSLSLHFGVEVVGGGGGGPNRVRLRV